ncbi:hypothetical protein [Streptomyces sp. P17]|uniref:hypothetical protein n=1 Tax=Streptomyces sp. P17 TaxID=3074716 RepID=UPI0028F45370|nr:hypothetical protein [Streptomyces sp. P17]MDT9699958.1 hypothetical protein [Streptomyces sp. P17]
MEAVYAAPAALPDDLRPTIQAAMFHTALRAAVEHYAARAEAELVATMRSALAVAAQGLA